LPTTGSNPSLGGVSLALFPLSLEGAVAVAADATIGFVVGAAARPPKENFGTGVAVAVFGVLPPLLEAPKLNFVKPGAGDDPGGASGIVGAVAALVEAAVLENEKVVSALGEAMVVEVTTALDVSNGDSDGIADAGLVCE